MNQVTKSVQGLAVAILIGVVSAASGPALANDALVKKVIQGQSPSQELIFKQYAALVERKGRTTPGTREHERASDELTKFVDTRMYKDNEFRVTDWVCIYSSSYPWEPDRSSDIVCTDYFQRNQKWPGEIRMAFADGAKPKAKIYKGDILILSGTALALPHLITAVNFRATATKVLVIEAK